MDEASYEGYFGDLDEEAEPFEDYWARTARIMEKDAEEEEKAMLENTL